MLAKEINFLKRKYGVNVIFTNCLKQDNLIGYCCDSENIHIDHSAKKSRSEFLCTFFHELGHIQCRRSNKWKVFHDIDPDSETSKQNLRKLIYTALKAERWVDRFAAKMLYEYDKRIKYDFPYYEKENAKHLQNNFLLPAKVRLRKDRKL